MRFDAACRSETGGRRQNEDRLCCCFHEKGFAAMVADGLGGEGGGEAASELAVERFREALPSLFPPSPDAVTAFFHEINGALLALQSGRRGVKTTAALLVADEKTALCAHRGDSRVYHFRDGKILYQSIDHSVSQAAVFAGEITPEQIRTHPDRGRLMGCLGITGFQKPAVRLGDLQTGDAFLLCSDGFWEYVLEEEMAAALAASRGAQGWLDAMLEYGDRRAEPERDNYSAVAVVYI